MLKMAVAKFYYTTSDKLQELPVQNGQIIFVPDKNTLCLDMNGQRSYYQTIKTFATDRERLDATNLIKGFYFVEETSDFWEWKNGWEKTTKSPVVYGSTVASFPARGKEGVLYYSDDGVYRWNKEQVNYKLIASVNAWDNI